MGTPARALWRARSLSEQADAEAAVASRAAAEGKPAGHTDLLLRLFDSEFFDEWIAVSYLWRSQSGGVHDYLCNRLYSLPDAGLERFLHQLCALAASRPTPTLMHTMVDLCKLRTTRFALKVCWYLAAANPADQKQGLELLQKLRTDVVDAALSAHGHFALAGPRAMLRLYPAPAKGERVLADANGLAAPRRRKPGIPRSPRTPPSDGAPSAECTFERTRNMVLDLCNTSTLLRSVFPQDDRKGILRQHLQRISETIETGDAGVLFPLGDEQLRVLRIPAEEAVLLNSRERAPFLICVEVVPRLPLEDEEDEDEDGEQAAGMDGGVIPEGDEEHEAEASADPFDDDGLTLPQTAAELAAMSPRVSGEFAGIAPPSEQVSKAIDSALAKMMDQQEEDARAAAAPQVMPRLSVQLRVVGPDVRVHIALAARKPYASPMRGAAHHRRVPSDIAMAQMALEVKRQQPAPPREASDVVSLSPAGERAKPSSAAVFGERWQDRKERVQRESPYGHLPGWTLKPVIVKSGDDCRQELLAVQVMSTFQAIFQEAGLPLWLRPYEILVTSTHSSLIEAVPDAPSIHSAKSRMPRGTSLRGHFVNRYGKGTPAFRAAQRNFVESMAAYSIVTFVLQLKDRHNGNILLADEGHIIHIDFSFMLSNSPGGINFEGAPFKLTRELLEVMDSDAEGTPSDAFNYYKVLTIQGFLAARKHADRLVQLVEMMAHTGCPCFRAGTKAIENMRKNFQLSLTEEQCVEYVLTLISDSLDAWSSRQYDYYQRMLNGIL